MKQFFRTIKQTFTSREFYRAAEHQFGWKGFRFLMKLALFLGLAVGVITAIALLAFLPRARSRAVDFASGTYPADLVITVADGALTTNTLDPVVIPVPAAWADDKSPKNLLVIAPGEAADLAVLSRYNSFAVATSHAIVAGTDNDVRIYGYGKGTHTITKPSFMQTVTNGMKIGGAAVALLAIPLALLVVLVHVISRLVFLIMVTAILWVIYKIRKQPHTFKQLYRMGMYALVPVILIDIVAVPFGLGGRALTTAIVLVIILSVTRDTVVAAPRDPVPGE